MKIDCVLMDIDGSTLDPDGAIPGELQAAIHLNASVQWVMVTGRGYASASLLPHAAIVSRTIPHIFDGGATVMSMNRSEILYADTLDCRATSDLVAGLDFSRTDYIYASEGTKGTGFFWFSEEQYPIGLVARRATKHASEFLQMLRSTCVAKLTICTESDLNPIRGFTLHRNGKVVDVTSFGVNKGLGARTVFEYMGLTPEKSIFVFNDANDLPVLEDSFFSKIIRLKVGPSLPLVRADYIAACPGDIHFVFRAFDFVS